MNFRRNGIAEKKMLLSRTLVRHLVAATQSKSRGGMFGRDINFSFRSMGRRQFTISLISEALGAAGHKLNGLRWFNNTKLRILLPLREVGSINSEDEFEVA